MAIAKPDSGHRSLDWAGQLLKARRVLTQRKEPAYYSSSIMGQASRFKHLDSGILNTHSPIEIWVNFDSKKWTIF